MRKRTIAGTTAAAVLAAGAAVIPLMSSAQAAPAAPAGHSLKYTSISLKGGELDSKTSTVFADKDVNAKGKTIGFDVLAGSYNPKTKKVTGFYTAAFLNGTISAAVSGNPATGLYTGKITAGAGAYKGIKGTVTAKDLNPQGTKTAVTIKYTG